MQGAQTEKYLNLREKITRECRILHNEELHNQLPSSVLLWQFGQRGLDELSQHAWGVRKPEDKRQLGQHRNKLEDNIKMNLIKMGCEDVEWIKVAHDRVQWLGVPKITVNFGFHKRQGNF